MSQFCQPTGLKEKGITAGLQYIDCNSERIIEYAFNRFFGPGGALGWALTIILTIYVALIAFRLLSGRGRLSGLPPRILGLGLILTFATSWIGYQSFVLNIALGAPEELAKILLNTKGSATYMFSHQLDVMFQAIARVALQSRGAGAGAEGAAGAMSAEGNLLWLGALMLLLGTVGVLIVARMALALMLALGPIFIILALFSGTRGLFVGWMKTVVMLAVTPLFAVLLGGGTLALIRPLVVELAKLNGEIDMRIAVNIFLAASVHVALMLMAIKLSTTLVSGWRLPWAETDGNGSSADSNSAAASAAALSASASALAAATTPQSSTESGPDQRTQSILRAVDQGMMASATSDPGERTGFARSFAMNTGDNPGNTGTSRRETNDVTQALGRKYRPATIGAVRLKREGAA
ncbi:type IV secretion system protein [Sphingorhabdus sp. IMCC26285]|jgi:type IV secretion system protein VirB6|uniref:Type IV secretion system protein n=1 Tax=Sphingorhabdus profundilacus TaxID=2509718 RepID=A0A6I4M1V4_9SPHN|nr:type IV secretion system protein [Sphingorhabdus profundilacus]MVZ98244.1 type IV secretion system protein [Sphingorhabdus profundilacus]